MPKAPSSPLPSFCRATPATQPGSAWKRAGCGIGSAAIWSFHGDADPTVPYAPDHDTVLDLIACPAPPRRDAKFTDVVGGGHEIWAPIYDLSGGFDDIYACSRTRSPDGPADQR